MTFIEGGVNERIYQPYTTDCPNCGKEFTPNKKQLRSLAVGKQKRAYCSPLCARQHMAIKNAGSNNPKWRGGKVDDHGYNSVHMPGYHEASPYVLEHRLIMERVLGRKLEDGEIVHHKNGDKKDNRPENLEVLTISEHMRHHATESHAARRSAEI